MVEVRYLELLFELGVGGLESLEVGFGGLELLDELLVFLDELLELL